MVNKEYKLKLTLKDGNTEEIVIPSQDQIKRLENKQDKLIAGPNIKIGIDNEISAKNSTLIKLGGEPTDVVNFEYDPQEQINELAGYFPEIVTMLEEKQDKLTAGENITIDPETNTISATGSGGKVGTTVTVGTAPVTELTFTSDPQHQIDVVEADIAALDADKASNESVALNAENIAGLGLSKQDKLAQVDLDNIAGIDQMKDDIANKQDKLSDAQVQSIGEIDAIKAIAIANQAAIPDKQDKLTPGEGITITPENVISAAGGGGGGGVDLLYDGKNLQKVEIPEMANYNKFIIVIKTSWTRFSIFADYNSAYYGVMAGRNHGGDYPDVSYYSATVFVVFNSKDPTLNYVDMNEVGKINKNTYTDYKGNGREAYIAKVYGIK